MVLYKSEHQVCMCSSIWIITDVEWKLDQEKKVFVLTVKYLDHTVFQSKNCGSITQLP
jgi:hypothetical protein